MAHFELPDGAFADLYDAKKIPERARRPIQRAAFAYQRLLPEKFGAKATVSEPPAGDTAATDALADAEPAPATTAFGAPPVEQIVAQATADPIRLRDLSDEALTALDAFNDALILGFTKEWSYGDVTEAALVELPGDAFDLLLAECRRLNKGEEEDPTETS